MYQYQGELRRIVDADTYILDLDLGFHVHIEHRIRLAGVDCPERGTLQGIQATQRAAAWWQRHQGRAIITVTHYDRYGRIIAEITSPTGESLTQALLAKDCTAYQGKR